MATEHLYASSSVTGDCDTPANATGTSDGTFTTDADNEDWTHEWHLDDPASSPDASQTITVDITCRKFDGSSDPDIVSVELLDGATSKGTDSTGWSITSLTSQVIQASITPTSWPSDGSDLRVKVVTAAAGGSPANRAAVQVDEFDVTLTTSVAAAAITPAAVTVTATPGSLVTTVGSVPITPDAVTVTATPGTVAVTIGDWDITPEAVTITATPGTVALTTGSVAVTPDPVTVTATPGGLTVTAPSGADDIVPAAVTVTATPGGLSVAAGSVPIVPESVTVTATPGSLAVTVGSVAITPAAVTVTATPGSVVVGDNPSQDITLVGPTVTVTPMYLFVTFPTPISNPVHQVDVVQATRSRIGAQSLHNEALFAYISEHDASKFESSELVGALNEINGTVGKGYAEARTEYLNANV